MVRRLASRSQLDRFDELDVDQRHELLHGHAMFLCHVFESVDEMRDAWRLHREAIREEWAENNPPGTRCFAEWLLELVPKFGERRTTPQWEEQCAEYRENWLRWGILHLHTIPPAQEPEYQFLYRNHVIDLREYKAAKAAAAEEAL